MEIWSHQSSSSTRWFCKSSCSARASACSLSCSTLASSWIRSCSRLCSSFASWRAFMASMSCCKTGASLPSDPCGPCLVFLITSKGSITNKDEIKFYRPHDGRQMILLVDLSWIGWRVALLVCLLLVHLNNASLGQRGLYLLITLRRSSQWEHTK